MGAAHEGARRSEVVTLKIHSGKVKRRPVMNVLIFGEPGVGKTVLAASGQGVPGLDQHLFLNVEGGDLSIMDQGLDSMTPGRGEDGRPNGRTLTDLEELATAIANRTPGFENYRTLIIDSVTELQIRDMDDFVKPGDAIELRDYGKSTRRMQRILRMLRDANVNVIFTALSQNIMQKKRGSNELELSEIGPQMTAKVANSLKGYVDFVWYYYITPEGERVLITAPKGPIKAKTRNDKFAQAIGPAVKNPNMGTLYRTLCSVFEEKEQPK